MAPDTPIPADPDEAERLALEVAIAEARAGGPGVPHEQVQRRMLEMLAEIRDRIARLDRRTAKGGADAG